MRNVFLIGVAFGFLTACGGGGGGGTQHDSGDVDDLAGPRDRSPAWDEATERDPAQTLDPGPIQDEGSAKDPGATYHPPGWAISGNDPFHGDEAKQGLKACTTCHGADLTGGAVGVSCETCHKGFKTKCTFCHGGVDTDNGAPPVDIHDQTATTVVTVGAHTAHVIAKSGLASPFDCVKCHEKPSSALDAGHLDGSPAEVLSALDWDRDNATCSNGYCHGRFQGGHTGNLPVWTKTGQAACGSCHDLPPSTGRHSSVYAKHAFMGKDCTHCHDGIANHDATLILNPALHVNTQKDVVLGSGGTWNPATKTCDPSCHGPKPW